MLFDLRSRGRRRTVQAVYLGLAVLMGGSLVLFGVGTGNGFGGLLDAFKGGGGGNNQKQVVSQDEQNALKQTKLRPADPDAWAALFQARWRAAGQGNNYNASTGTFSASGQKELTGAAQAWQRYLKLVKRPDADLSILAGRAYSQLGQYARAADTWETETLLRPNESKGYQCLAANAYAAKENRKGDLASQRALALSPKLSRPTLKQELLAAKTDPRVAQSC